MNFQKIAAAPRQQAPRGVVQFQGFPHGLNTSVPSFQIQQTECAALINFKINRGGQLETRKPIVAYTSTATIGNAAVKTFAQIPIGGTNYELIVDENHKLYYLNAGTPTLIGTLDGDAQLLAYNGVAIILDGGYIKFLDSVSEIHIAYDAGAGGTTCIFCFLNESDDSTIALGDGTNSRIAQKFTTEDFGAGYTIPSIGSTFKLSKTGAGYSGTDNVDIMYRVRKVSDDSVVAEKVFIEAPIEDHVADTITEYSVSLAPEDSTEELAPATAYYACLEYANGNISHYVNVHATNVTSGGMSYYYTGSWVNSSTQNFLCKGGASPPPKGSFGTVSNARLFVAGDPDNPGYVWYSNLTHLDWSTPDGGGWVGAVDENKNNYDIGALVNLYGDLFVFGKEDQPYLCKLTGSSPSAYSLPVLFQRVWSTHRTALSVVNDVFSGSADGIDSLSGVQEYGDMRTFSASDPVYDRIRDYWNTATAFAGYYPRDGQYLLCMPDYHRLLVSHVKIPSAGPAGQSLRYPWCEYELYRDELTSDSYKWTNKSGDIYYLEAAAGGDPGFNACPDALTLDGRKITKVSVIGNLDDHKWWFGDDDSLGYNTVYFQDATGDPDTSDIEIRSVLIPTCFANFGGIFYIGGSDGLIYKIDESDYKDQASIQVSPIMATSYIETPFTHVNLTDFQIASSSKGGASLAVRFYTNGAEAADLISYALSVYDGLTVDEATMDVDDALFSIDADSAPLFKQINMNVRSFQLMVRDITLTGWPLYINNLAVKYRQLQE